jgi:hypothetical protein
MISEIALGDIMDLILKTIEIDYNPIFRDSLTSLGNVLTAEIYEVIDNFGESRNDYHICFNPFSIERLDNKPIPNELLIAVQSKFQ